MATKASRKLKQTAREPGVELEPMHPDVDDPNLQAYFMVEVPSYEQAQEVISTLQNLSAVGWCIAYIKPAEADPHAQHKKRHSNHKPGGL